MKPRIYFDNAATTPLDPRVREAMQPYLGTTHGNPSSLHWEGRQAREAVEQSRRQVADLLGAEPGEIVFTSGGTEGNNLAIRGVLDNVGGQGNRHIVISPIEHPAVLACCERLERQSVQVTKAAVDGDGIVDPTALEGVLRPETRLVSIMAANNVLGTIQPVGELAGIARRHGILFHTDAVQAVGKLPFDLHSQPIDLLSLSAHKFHGPKGVGALYVRKGVALASQMPGGGQEGDRRSGTENVPGIVGLGAAAEIARTEMANDAARLVKIRDYILGGVASIVGNAYVIGDRYRRLPGHICLGFDGQEGEAIKLLMQLDEAGIAVSSGSACSMSHAGQPSHVLEAIGFDAFKARGSLRVTLGRFNTLEEADRFLEALSSAVASLRSIRSFHGSAGPLRAAARPSVAAV
jgi:cysteine desulfurase